MQKFALQKRRNLNYGKRAVTSSESLRPQIPISQYCFTLILVLGKKSYFEITYFESLQYNKFKEYQPYTCSFSSAPSIILSTHAKFFGSLIFFQHFSFYFFFMIVLYLKWCEASHRFCVNENVWLFFFQLCFSFCYFVFVSRIFSAN